MLIDLHEVQHFKDMEKPLKSFYFRYTVTHNDRNPPTVHYRKFFCECTEVLDLNRLPVFETA